MKQEMKADHRLKTDMTTHEPNRQVTDGEKNLWHQYTDYAASTDEEYLSVTSIAKHQTALSEQRSRQIVATWENEGLVTCINNHNRAMLTEYGRQVKRIESNDISGPDWTDRR